MSHTPHELHEEFPAEADHITALKTADAAFAALADRYHTVNRAIHRAETDVEPTDDANLQAMRRDRMHLKDQIAARLREPV
jgi:uncharacterized protein YdcH (DUF465 family)